MPIEQFTTAKETTDSIQSRIESVHRAFEGAQVRVAWARVNSGACFLTGTVVFLEHEPESRGTADYGHIRLSEFWIKGVDAAISFVGRLFEGKESIGGIPIRSLFKRSMAHRESGRHSASGWPSWIYEASAESTDGQQRLNLEPIPTVAKGLPPFKSPSDAVANWIGQHLRHGIVSGNVPNQDQFVIVIPDTRARFKSCRWSPGSLSLGLELNIAPKFVELQILHGGAKSRFANHTVQPGSMSFGVPEDTNDLALYLVHASGDLLVTQTLTQLYRGFKKRGRSKLLPRLSSRLRVGDDSMFWTILLSCTAPLTFAHSGQSQREDLTKCMAAITQVQQIVTQMARIGSHWGRGRIDYSHSDLVYFSDREHALKEAVTSRDGSRGTSQRSRRFLPQPRILGDGGAVVFLHAVNNNNELLLRSGMLAFWILEGLIIYDRVMAG